MKLTKDDSSNLRALGLVMRRSMPRIFRLLTGGRG